MKYGHSIRRSALQAAMQSARTQAEFLELARRWRSLGGQEGREMTRVCLEQAQLAQEDARQLQNLLQPQPPAVQAALSDEPERDKAADSSPDAAQKRRVWLPVLLAGLVLLGAAVFLIAGWQAPLSMTQPGAGPAEFPTLSAGYGHTVGLCADGTVAVAGSPGLTAEGMEQWQALQAVSAGQYFTVALDTNGRAMATGNNDFGQCDVEDWRNLVAVSAGGWHCVGLRADGTAVATGSNDFGQCDVEDWENLVAICADAATPWVCGLMVRLWPPGTLFTASARSKAGGRLSRFLPETSIRWGCAATAPW